MISKMKIMLKMSKKRSLRRNLKTCIRRLNKGSI